MSLPPSEFAQTFRALVVPKLRPLIERKGASLNVAIVTFSEARAAVVTEGMRLGAGFLPPEHLTAFIDWVDREILIAADVAEAKSEAIWRDSCECDQRIREWHAGVSEHA